MTKTLYQLKSKTMMPTLGYLSVSRFVINYVIMMMYALLIVSALLNNLTECLIVSQTSAPVDFTLEQITFVPVTNQLKENYFPSTYSTALQNTSDSQSDDFEKGYYVYILTNLKIQMLNFQMTKTL